jgi:hypothetical protein
LALISVISALACAVLAEAWMRGHRAAEGRRALRTTSWDPMDAALAKSERRRT